MKHLLIVLMIWNIIVFLMMGTDKWKAKNDKHRISEKTLLLCSLFMGAFGGGAGMLVFHHKTRKLKFQILIPLAFLLNLAVFIGVIYMTVNGPWN